MSNLRGVDPPDIRIGMKVQVGYEATSGGHQVPVFDPVRP